MATIILHPNQEHGVLAGQACIFNSQIQQISGEARPGDIVEIKSAEKKFLGRGHVNPAAPIAVRVLTRVDEPIDEPFFRKRLSAAWQLRKLMFDERTDAYRLVFSEADFLPGLIIDIYGHYCVVQTYTWGMESHLKLIVTILQDLIKPRGIYLRNDSPVRLKEGLLLEKRAVHGRFDTKQHCWENGVKFCVDLQNGQKTGLYLDRRQARQLLNLNLKGKKVLDCFCYNGAFSMFALASGADQVTGIDLSAHALAQANLNASLNNFDPRRFSFQEGNVFERLNALAARKEKFDVVIIDPPSLGAAKHNLESLEKSSRQLNAQAIKLLSRSGILLSCNSSAYLTEDMFRRLVAETANQEGGILRYLDQASQPPDHPGFLNKKETLYFKCLLGQLI